MDEDIRWASRKNQSIHNADYWYNFYFRKQFCEYGQDYRRVFTTPTHIRETIEILPILFPKKRLSESEKFALDTAMVFGSSVLHDPDSSAMKLFETCYTKSSFAHGFFMIPFPLEVIISSAQIIQSGKSLKSPSVNTTLCDIYSDANRYFVAREYEYFLNKLNYNLQERVLVNKSEPTLEYSKTMVYLTNLLDEQIFKTEYGKKHLEKLAIRNILYVMENGIFDEKTSTII